VFLLPFPAYFGGGKRAPENLDHRDQHLKSASLAQASNPARNHSVSGLETWLARHGGAASANTSEGFIPRNSGAARIVNCQLSMHRLLLISSDERAVAWAVTKSSRLQIMHSSTSSDV
jgi:hypothetical protein